MGSPVRSSKIEVNYKGRAIKGGITLFSYDDHYFKSLLHSKVKRGNYSGSQAWHVPVETTDEFARQIVAEQLVTKSTGRQVWIQHYRHNHYLDCEKLNEVCGHVLNVSRIQNDGQSKEEMMVLNKGENEDD